MLALNCSGMRVDVLNSRVVRPCILSRRTILVIRTVETARTIFYTIPQRVALVIKILGELQTAEALGVGSDSVYSSLSKESLLWKICTSSVWPITLD